MVHEHQAAQAVKAGAAQHREQAQLGNALMQSGDHFPVSKVVAFKEPVHQSLVGFGHGFLQSAVKFFNDGNLVFGHIDLHPLLVLHLVGALVQHVDDAGDLVAGVPDGNYHGSNLVAVLFPEGFKGGVVVGVILIHLGDVNKPGHIPLFTVFPGFFEANGDAVLGRAHQNGGVRSPQSLHHRAGEVKGAGSIQQVDAHVVIIQGNHRGGDGNVTADFLGIIVRNGVAVGIFAHTVNGTGHVKQALSQGGLAAAAVTEQTDVADGINGVHVVLTPFGKASLPSGRRHPNEDIIHERPGDCNVYFRQNAKLHNFRGGHLHSWAKHTKFTNGNQTGCTNNAGRRKPVPAARQGGKRESENQPEPSARNSAGSMGSLFWVTLK